MNIVYLAKGKLHLLEGDKAPTIIESKFGQTVRDRAVRISQRDSWKNEGPGAQFMAGRLLWGGHGDDPSEMRIAMKSLSRGPEAGRLLYALETDDMGGVFSVKTGDLEEQRLFHHADCFVEHLNAGPGHDHIACAVRNQGGTANIATMKADEAIKAKYRDTGEIPGLVPSTWHLVRQTGERKEVLAKGVLSYDICGDGSIVYTNGNAIYRREADGKCGKVHVDDGIEQVIVMGTPQA